MSFAKRLVYLGYYFRQLDSTLLRKFMYYTREQHSVSMARQWLLLITNSLKYNISLQEFYQFGFIDKSSEGKAKWAGTGTMYEFQLQANPPETRGLLSDKRRFYQAYRQFFQHEMFTLEELKNNAAVCEKLITNNDRIVMKQADGNCGAQVAFVKTSELTPDNLVSRLVEGGYDLVETFAVQHEALNRLSPSAVNTVRIFTRLNELGECIILGCRLRISVDSPVDNLAAGNLAAPVGQESGRVTGPGVYSDITKSPETVHPVTGVNIIGFQIPFWKETLDMVRHASMLHPENRSIGWDIVITPDGPGLIEGNHDWCKLVWQLPVGRGLKSMLYDQAVEQQAESSG